MPALLFQSDIDPAARWAAALRREMPEIDFREWPELGDPGDIEYALVWRPPPGAWRRLTNLKVIFSLGAGLDHLLGEPDLPAHVPVVRMVDPSLTEGMREYVLLHVLRFHRHMPCYAAQQRERAWRALPQVRPRERRVGILGLGTLGGEVARALAALEFRVTGWSRGAKSIAGVECLHGPHGLARLLAGSQILVCLLPLTAATEGIINRRTLAQLPAGACLINAARGGHVVEEDLLRALASGHIAGAALDVFREEPLPPEHSFWSHPQVSVTPHVASLTNPQTAAPQIVENIRRRERGEPLRNVVDRDRGY